MRNPISQPLPSPLLYGGMGGVGDEPRAEPATDQRTSELSRLLQTPSSSNFLKRPSLSLLETGSSSNRLEDDEKDENVAAEKKPSKGPSLWRC